MAHQVSPVYLCAPWGEFPARISTPCTLVVNPLLHSPIDTDHPISKMFETFTLQIVSNIIGEKCQIVFHPTKSWP